MPKFFVDERDIYSDRIVIAGDDVNHIRKVLRLGPGDRITVCDGKGKDYLVSIESLNHDSIVTVIISAEKNCAEPLLEVELFQGIPKADKMDLIIQKCVELGVKKIVPITTERAVIKLQNREDARNKISRWQRISLEAAKQCNRGIVPRVEFPMGFEEALELCKAADLGIIPYEKEHDTRVSLKECIRGEKAAKIAVMIGPEGGFSEDEIKKAIDSGLKPVTLGPRILRTETAGIAVLSILMYELGDVGGLFY